MKRSVYSRSVAKVMGRNPQVNTGDGEFGSA
jgi:hypothetical protein